MDYRWPIDDPWAMNGLQVGHERARCGLYMGHKIAYIWNLWAKDGTQIMAILFYFFSGFFEFLFRFVKMSARIKLVLN